MIRATHGIIQGQQATTDPDAAAFIAATGIVDATIISDIETLVTDLKSNSLWTKFLAIYPFVGGTAATHKFNLKDPQDTDAAFRLTFHNTVTHDANGVTFVSGHADTKLIPISSLTENDTHMSYYSRTTTSFSANDMGMIDNVSNNRILLICRHGATATSICDQYDGATTTRISASVADGSGFFVPTRVANNDHRLFRNGAQAGINTNTISPTGFADVNRAIFIGAANFGGGGLGISPRNCAFATIGSGFSPAEAATCYTIVQNFQTSLGRQV